MEMKESSNCTLLELKPGFDKPKPNFGAFKLYLTGIETIKASS